MIETCKQWSYRTQFFFKCVDACVCMCMPTSYQFQLLPGVPLSVELRMAAVAYLADEACRQRHQVPADQHTVAVLQGQGHCCHLRLVLDWWNASNNTKSSESLRIIKRVLCCAAKQKPINVYASINSLDYKLQKHGYSIIHTLHAPCLDRGCIFF